MQARAAAMLLPLLLTGSLAVPGGLDAAPALDGLARLPGAADAPDGPPDVDGSLGLVPVRTPPRVQGLVGGLSVWVPASEATVHPGVSMTTAGEQCTANFVFTRGADVFLGYAAHCAAEGSATSTNGCDLANRPLPLGTPVTIEGADAAGTLAYTSWGVMQSVGEADAAACANNDFAVVRLAAADHGNVNPSVPGFGGPTALGPPPALLSTVYSYQNSGLRLGLTPLSPKEGVSLGPAAGGWAIRVYLVTPGIPGDSGSGLLDDAGRATGALSAISAAPYPGSNKFTALDEALAYAAAHGHSFTLAVGTEPFAGGTLPTTF